jgi:hypothetical protein
VDRLFGCLARVASPSHDSTRSFTGVHWGKTHIEVVVFVMERSFGLSTADDPPEEVQAKISKLENVRILLEEARVHAREMEDAQGEHIQARIRTTLGEVNRRILELKGS